MKTTDQKGFSGLEGLLILVIVGIIGGVGWFVYNSQKKTASTLDKTSQSQGEPQKTVSKATPPTQQTASQSDYLNIKELGIRFKLTNNIKDAYYYVSSNKDSNNITTVYVSTHSVDAYPGCQASKNNGAGIAAIATYYQGETSPVAGDYSTTFPRAPKIGDLYYYIAGNQYDCTEQKNTDLYTKIHQEFMDAYTTIEKL